MAKRPRTPEELSTGGPKETVNFYVEIELVEYLKKKAAKSKLSVSVLVNEAIRSYVETLKDVDNSDK